MKMVGEERKEQRKERGKVWKEGRRESEKEGEEEEGRMNRGKLRRKERKEEEGKEKEGRRKEWRKEWRKKENIFSKFAPGFCQEASAILCSLPSLTAQCESRRLWLGLLVMINSR